MLHADALYFSLLLLLFYGAFSVRNLNWKILVLGAMLINLLILTKINNLVFLVIFPLVVFLADRTFLKVVFSFSSTLIGMFIWNMLNGEVITHLSPSFDLQGFFEAFEKSVFSFGEMVSVFLFSKVVYRLPLNVVVVIGISVYLIISVMLIYKSFSITRKKVLFLTVSLFFILYPIALILIPAKLGHSEIDRRTLFPFFLSMIFIVFYFLEINRYRVPLIGTIVTLFFLISIRVTIQVFPNWLNYDQFTVRDVMKANEKLRKAKAYFGEEVYSSSYLRAKWYFVSSENMIERMPYSKIWVDGGEVNISFLEKQQRITDLQLKLQGCSPVLFHFFRPNQTDFEFFENNLKMYSVDTLISWDENFLLSVSR
ncbi:hypothetical protein [Algoriphagus namhaensis]